MTCTYINAFPGAEFERALPRSNMAKLYGHQPYYFDASLILLGTNIEQQENDFLCTLQSYI